MATSTTAKGDLYGSNLVAYIAGHAKALRLDPAAVLSVASVEGGFQGAVGDKGTSFGPFQLHQGGRLPAGMSAQQAQIFANSPAGVDYALRGIAGVASGQTGTTAITSIVTRFEQPQDPSAEIASASSRYADIQKNIKNIKAAEKAGPGSGLTPGKGSIAAGAIAPIIDTAHFLGKITDPANILRAMEVIAGGVLILLGLIMIVLGGRGTPASQTTRAVRTVTA